MLRFIVLVVKSSSNEMWWSFLPIYEKQKYEQKRLLLYKTKNLSGLNEYLRAKYSVTNLCCTINHNTEKSFAHKMPHSVFTLAPFSSLLVAFCKQTSNYLRSYLLISLGINKKLLLWWHHCQCLLYFFFLRSSLKENLTMKNQLELL